MVSPSLPAVSPSSLLRAFTPGRTPRPGQQSALEALERSWSQAEVFVIEAPTGAGKSDLATTIARWSSSKAGGGGRSLVVVPTNVLLEQYLEQNPRAATLQAKRNYSCLHAGRADSAAGMTCEERANRVGGLCKGCPYTAANRRIRAVPWGVVNSWTYLAHRLYPDTLIWDEAHTALAQIREMAGKKLWQKDYHFPDNIETYADLLKWAAAERRGRKARGEGVDPKLEMLHADLQSGEARYLVEQGTEPLRGKEQKVLKLLPIDTSSAPPLLWPPGRVKRIVLLSATIGPRDLDQLGLGGRRVVWIKAPSAIQPNRRPIQVLRPGIDLSHAADAAALDTAVRELTRLADAHPDTRGFWHLTYALLDSLLPRLPERVKARLITHRKWDRSAQLARFLSTDSHKDAIFVACGLQEGVDLAGDKARWQVVAKVPWPSLGEPAWKWLAESDPERYEWEALRLVLQASGRVSRGPEDYGVTYVLDRSFNRLPAEQMPGWFLEGLQAGEQL